MPTTAPTVHAAPPPSRGGGGGEHRPSSSTAVDSSSSSSRRAAPLCRRAIHLRLRDDPAVVLRVPLRHVSHHPLRALAPDTRRPRDLSGRDSSPAAPPPPTEPPPPLYLCEAYTGSTGCPAAPGTCPDVHADVSTATRLYPHHRRRLLDGEQLATTNPPREGDLLHPPRFDASAAVGGGDPQQLLLVAAPNESVATLRVAPHECLATRALEAAKQPLSLCAHFLGPKAVCDFGAACQFVHPAPGAAITVDPASEPEPHPLRSHIDLVALATVYPPPPSPHRHRHHSAATAADSRCGGGASTAPRSVGPPSTSRTDLHAKKASASTSLFLATVHSVSASEARTSRYGSWWHHGSAASRRYRHDPYGHQGWINAAPPPVCHHYPC